MVEDGMKGIEAPQKTKTPAKRVSGVERSDSQNEVIAAIGSLKNYQLKSLFGIIPKDKNKNQLRKYLKLMMMKHLKALP